MRAKLVLFVGIAVCSVMPFPLDGWAEGDMRAGGKLGVSMATLARTVPSPSSIDRVLKTGATGGVYGSLLIIQGAVDVAAQAEILVTARGTRFKNDDMNLGGYYLSYLDAPFLVRISLPMSKRWVPYALSGPRISFLLSASQTDAGGGKRSIREVVRSYDAGLVLGLGGAWQPSFSGQVFVELRYDSGLLLVDGAAGNDGVFKNRTVSFMIGYSPDLFQRRPRASLARQGEPAAEPEAAEPEAVEPEAAEPDAAEPGLVDEHEVDAMELAEDAPVDPRGLWQWHR